MRTQMPSDTAEQKHDADDAQDRKQGANRYTPAGFLHDIFHEQLQKTEITARPAAPPMAGVLKNHYKGNGEKWHKHGRCPKSLATQHVKSFYFNNIIHKKSFAGKDGECPNLARNIDDPRALPEVADCFISSGQPTMDRA